MESKCACCDFAASKGTEGDVADVEERGGIDAVEESGKVDDVEEGDDLDRFVFFDVLG